MEHDRAHCHTPHSLIGEMCGTPYKISLVEDVLYVNRNLHQLAKTIVQPCIEQESSVKSDNRNCRIAAFADLVVSL